MQICSLDVSTHWSYICIPHKIYIRFCRALFGFYHTSCGLIWSIYPQFPVLIRSDPITNQFWLVKEDMNDKSSYSVTYRLECTLLFRIFFQNIGWLRTPYWLRRRSVKYACHQTSTCDAHCSCLHQWNIYQVFLSWKPGVGDINPSISA